ncbi:MAG: hypothetical protein JNN30_17765 [Rhodanobacteraceae bacterium]|nr:hypothetical protein [Rhodanobacteraceae bacterium]
MKVVAQESWAWTLYGDESDALYLSVLCGTVGLFTVDFQLDEHEVSRFRAAGDSAVQELADRVRSEPSKHLARHIDNFKLAASFE